MHVARASLSRPGLAPLAGLVKVPAAFFDDRPIGPHRRVLVGVVPFRNEHRAFHAVNPRRQPDRLAVFAGARGDDAPGALLRRHRANEIQAAADLEGAGRIVILVLDPDRQARRLVEERMAQERRARNVWRDALARHVDIMQGRWSHRRVRTHSSRVATAMSGRSEIIPSTPQSNKRAMSARSLTTHTCTTWPSRCT